MDVMNLLESIKKAGGFTISLQLLFLYSAALILFFLLHKLLVLLRPQFALRGKASQAAGFLITAGANLALCWAFLRLAHRTTDMAPRIAMLLVPMFIMGEFSFKRSRNASPAERGLEWAVFAGVLAGIAAGILLFYKGMALT